MSQTSFIFKTKNTRRIFFLVVTTVGCGVEHDGLWGVQGEDKMFVGLFCADGSNIQSLKSEAYSQRMRKHCSQIRLQNSSYASETVASTPVLTMKEQFPEHTDYVGNVLLEHENLMAGAINQLDFGNRLAKLDGPYSLSRVSGILAARAMNLGIVKAFKAWVAPLLFGSAAKSSWTSWVN